MAAQAPLIDAAIEHCRAELARGSKSFALAGRLLPQPARDRAAVIYTWCRRADDAIDECAPGRQRDALARLEAELDLVYSPTRPRDRVLAAFQSVIRAVGIPVDYPRELLAGMAMDVDGYRYRTMDDLLTYCYRVASTVGLMMCHVMELDDPRALRNAAHLGMAMQLTNICRDVAEDWERGRLYVPDDLLAECGAEDLRSQLGGPLPTVARDALADALQILLTEAERLYQSGDRGLRALRWRFSVAIRAARLIYAEIGCILEQRRCDVFEGRAVVPTRTKLELVGRAVRDEVLTGPDRARGWLRTQLTSPIRASSILCDTVLHPRDVLPL